VGQKNKVSAAEKAEQTRTPQGPWDKKGLEQRRAAEVGHTTSPHQEIQRKERQDGGVGKMICRMCGKLVRGDMCPECRRTFEEKYGVEA